ncbi:hypothetical protein GTQ40_05360 [Flavobacteriaceae bacterium R38]|nr:hypothetical protein [Flavobacteriaceae bacterium R38]
MRTGLAEKLLVKIMEWTPEEVNNQRPLLQALSNFKYNEYQQFSIGTLFIESLVKWLNKFENVQERKIAYKFFMNQVIFFSSNQILHLVNTTFNTVIQPVLVDKTANISQIDKTYITKVILSDHYTKILRRSLFIGLSDGAKIDQLRRSSKLNNEQVIPTYEVNNTKVGDMIKELKNTGEKGKFDTVFLVDDFTASGTSYFRNENGKWGGKIYKTIKAFFDSEEPLSNLIDTKKKLDIHLVFYIATTEAKNKIDTLRKEALSDGKYSNLSFKIHVLQLIEPSIKNDILKNEENFIKLSEKYIDSSIIDRHFRKAKYDKYYLGYNECCLPIILSHNTPNNSLPLLWWTSEQKNFIGIFPRITRHS